MLKKILFALCCLCAVSVSAQELKFGHLNTQEFIQNMPETKEVLKKLDDTSKKYENELLKMREMFQKSYADLTAQADTLPPAIRERRAQEVAEMQQKITNFNETAMEDIQKMQQQLITPIQEKVRKAILEVAAEQGYIYVFDTAVLLHFSAQSTDIAPLIKKKLNLP